MKLQLSQPVTPFVVTQKFGDISNLAYYKANGINFVGHNGMDLMTYHGQPIYAAHDGVAYYEVDSQQGHGVVIISNDNFEDINGISSKFKTIYWHMVDSAKEPKFTSPVEKYRDLTKNGLPVKAGDLIGYANSTGLSTGDHLHFGLKPVAQGEPEWTWTNLEQNNGYMGAVDPSPYIVAPKASIWSLDKNLIITTSGDRVAELQRALRELGYFNYTITGYYGKITASALQAFQEEFGIIKLPIESLFGGICGPRTRIALLKVLNK